MASVFGFGPMGVMPAEKAANPADRRQTIDKLASDTQVPANVLLALEEAGETAEVSAGRLAQELKAGKRIEDVVPRETLNRAYDIADDLYPAPKAAPTPRDNESITGRIGTAFSLGMSAAQTRSEDYMRDLGVQAEKSHAGKFLTAAQNWLWGTSETPESKAEAARAAPKSDQYGAATENLKSIAESGFQTTSLSDISDIGSAIRFFTDNAAQSLPQMGAALAGGPLSPALTTVMLGAEVNAEIKEKAPNLPEGERLKLASGAGLAMAGFELIGLGAIFGRSGASDLAAAAATGKLKQVLAQRGIKGSAARVLEAGIIEGSTEAIQEGITMAAGGLAGGDYDAGEVAERLANAFGAGGAVGSGLRAGVEPFAQPPKTGADGSGPGSAAVSEDGVFPPVGAGPGAAAPTDTLTPTGPISTIAGLAPDMTPQPEPEPAQPRFPDYKPGKEVRLADPVTGVIHDAVVVSESPGGIIVRIAGGEIEIDPATFDQARIAALTADEKAAGKKPKATKAKVTKPPSLGADAGLDPTTLTPAGATQPPIAPAPGKLDAPKLSDLAKPQQPAERPQESAVDLTPEEALTQAQALAYRAEKGGWTAPMKTRHAKLMAIAGGQDGAKTETDMQTAAAGGAVSAGDQSTDSAGSGRDAGLVDAAEPTPSPAPEQGLPSDPVRADGATDNDAALTAELFDKFSKGETRDPDSTNQAALRIAKRVKEAGGTVTPETMREIAAETARIIGFAPDERIPAAQALVDRLSRAPTPEIDRAPPVDPSPGPEVDAGTPAAAVRDSAAAGEGPKKSAGDFDMEIIRAGKTREGESILYLANPELYDLLSEAKSPFGLEIDKALDLIKRAQAIGRKDIAEEFADRMRRQAERAAEDTPGVDGDSPRYAAILESLAKRAVKAKEDADVARAALIGADTKADPKTNSGDAKTNSAPKTQVNVGASTIPSTNSGLLAVLSPEKQARADELKKRLADKMRNQVSSGLDPEYITLGGELVKLYIEAGAKRFGAMLAEFAETTGLSLKQAQEPLRAAYNHVRDNMELAGESIEGMDDAKAVLAEARKAIESVPGDEGKATEPVAKKAPEAPRDRDPGRPTGKTYRLENAMTPAERRIMGASRGEYVGEVFAELDNAARRADADLRNRDLDIDSFDSTGNRDGKPDQMAWFIREAEAHAKDLVAQVKAEGAENVGPLDKDEDTGDWEYDDSALSRALEFLDQQYAMGLGVDEDVEPGPGTDDDTDLSEMDPALIFPAPKGTKNLDAVADREGFIPMDEASARLAFWKKTAAGIGSTTKNRDKVILSLFDYKGTWSQPWRDAGYTVIQHDIKTGSDLLRDSWIYDRITEIREGGKEVHGVLSACPCTTFTGSGARWWEERHDVESPEALAQVFGDMAVSSGAKSALEYNVMLVDATRDAIRLANPTAFHVLENPVGRIQDKAKMPSPLARFHPHNFGDPYTKRTQLFGTFQADLPLANVSPVEGSKMQNKLRGSDPLGKEDRSTTPEGFAYAFFMANDPDARAVKDEKGGELGAAEGDRPPETPTADDMAAAAAETDPNPTPAQAEAENYKTGKIDWRGLTLSIENAKGSTRRKVTPDGKTAWEVVMPAHYGRILGTTGADGDHVDFYMADSPESERVFVIDQRDADTGRFDEIKVILGANTPKQAFNVYTKGFSDGRGEERAEAISETSVEGIKSFLQSRDATGSFAGTKGAAWTVPSPTLRGLAERPGALPESAQPALPQLRGPGDNGAPAPDELPAVSGRGGRETDAAAPTGPGGQRAGVSAGQPALADEEGTGAQYAQEPSSDRGRGNQDADRMGGPDESGSVNDPLPLIQGDVGRASGPDAGASQRTPVDRLIEGTIYVADSDTELTVSPDGPWDFNETYPSPDPAQVGRLEVESRSPFDANSPEEVSSILDETMLDAVDSRATANRWAREIERIEAGEKPTFKVTKGKDPLEEAEENFAKASAAFNDTVGAVEDVWGAKGANAFRKEASDRAAQSEQPETKAPPVPTPSAGLALSDSQSGENPATIQAPTTGKPRNEQRRNKKRNENQPDLFAGTGDGVDGAGRPAPGRQSDGRGEADQDAAGSGPGPEQAGSLVGDQSGVPDRVGAPPPNFVMPADFALGAGSDGQKLEANLAALRLIQTLESENRYATPEEQAVLARWVGWGGLKTLFDEKHAGTTTQWGRGQAELKRLLTKTEYFDAMRSTNDAHYTSRTVVEAMWGAFRNFGFTGGRALEPTIGSGNFLGLQPGDLSAATDWFAAELDPVTGKIAKNLYPRATVFDGMGFQDAPFRPATFDVAIGNPPFGGDNSRVGNKKMHPDLGRMKVHNFVIAKTGQLLREGGIMGMVVTHRFLDAMDAEARDVLAGGFHFLGAVRLPNTAFKANAGTEVTTDIVFFQKRKAGDEAGDTSWMGTNADGPNGTKMNAWFANNPDMILGRPAMDGTMYARGSKAGEFTVHDDGRDLVGALREAMAKIKASLPDRETQLEDAVTAPQTVSALPYGEMMVTSDGKIFRGEIDESGNPVVEEITQETFWKANAAAQFDLVQALRPFADGNVESTVEATQRVRDAAVAAGLLDMAGDPVTQSTKFEQALADAIPALLFGRPTQADKDAFASYAQKVEAKRLGSDGFDRLKGLLDLRGRMKALVRAERNDDPAIEQIRGGMRQAYQAFRKSFGFLNNPKNEAILQGDIGPEMALEIHYKPGKGDRAESGAEAPILTKRVIYPHKLPERMDSVSDALHVSMQERGYIDPGLIAQLTDKTAAEVISEITSGERPMAFMNPDNNRFELAETYLSGNLAEKIEKATRARAYEHIPHLRAAMPPAKTQEQITPSIRSMWIPKEVFQDFLGSLGYPGASVMIAEKVGMVAVQAGSGASNDYGQQFATKRLDAAEIFEHAIRGKIPVVYDTIRTQDGDRRVKNDDDTKDAVAAYERISAEFPNWAYANPVRVNTIVDAFNTKVNVVTPRKYEGTRYLRTVGTSPLVKLRNSQKNGAWRMIQDKVVLLHHVVGAGKTMTGITGIMERKRMGLTRKAVVVVPNHLTGQWGKEWLELYPAANILVPTEKDFDPSNRAKLINRIATGDFDAVILGHSQLVKIENDEAAVTKYIEEELDALNDAMQEAKRTGESRRTVGQMGARIQKLKEKLNKLTEEIEGRRGTGLLPWHELGVDYLLLDESQEFKNLEYSTTASQLVGMNDPNGSQKAFDLLMKVRSLQSMPNGGIGFMTGTPISNSLVEIYSVMKYMIPDSLESMGIKHFDAWKSAFIQDQSRFEYTASMQLKERNVMSGMVNLGPLAELYRSFSDIVMRPDVERMYREQMEAENAADPTKPPVSTRFPTPRVQGGSRRIMLAPPTDRMSEFTRYLVMRMGGIQNAPDKKAYAKIDNPLWVLTDARKASVDIRTIDPSAAREEGAKVSRSANEIFRIWKANADRKGAQMVFSDMSTPSKNATKAATAMLKDAYGKLGLKKDALKRRMAEDEGKSYAARWADAVGHIEEIIGSPATPDATRDALSAWASSPDVQDASAAMATADTGFSFYDDLRTVLMEKGIPEQEIAFIHDYDTTAKKRDLFESVNEGKVRVLIGSTMKMGAGTNAQRRLVALHHIDAPWRPSDMEQREGRIIRQGNLFYEQDPDGFEVEIIAYSTEKTSDVVQWQVLERKAKAIETFLSAATDTLAEEGGDADQYAEFMAQSTGKKVFLEKMATEKEIISAKGAISSALRARSEAKGFVENFDGVVSRLRNNIAVYGNLNADALPEGSDEYMADWHGQIGAYRVARDKAEAEAEEVRKRNAGKPRKEWEKLPEQPNAPKRWETRPANSYDAAVFDAIEAATKNPGDNSEVITLGRGYKIEVSAKHAGEGGLMRYDVYLVPPVGSKHAIPLADLMGVTAKNWRLSEKLLAAFDPKRIVYEATSFRERAERDLERHIQMKPKMEEVLAKPVDESRVKTLTERLASLSAEARIEEVKYAEESAAAGENRFAMLDTKGRNLSTDGMTKPLKGQFQFTNAGRTYASEWGAPAGRRRIEGTDKFGEVAYFEANDMASGDAVILEATQQPKEEGQTEGVWKVERVFQRADDGAVKEMRDFTAEGKADKPVDDDTLRAITKELNAEAEKHGLAGKITVRAVRQVALAAGVRLNSMGAFDRNDGEIQVRADAGEIGIKGVMRHEIIHALRSAKTWGKEHGLFTAQEWSVLERAALADTKIRDSVLDRYPSLTPEAQLEEMVAELYRLWADGRDVAGPLGKVLQKIRNFFTALARMLRGKGNLSAAQIMEDIASGAVGGRSPTPGGGSKIKTDTPAFKNWFGKSVTVEETGKPMVLKHGTKFVDQIDVFMPMTHFGTAKAASDRIETDERQIDDKFSTEGRIYPVYVSIKNPLNIGREQGFGDLGAWSDDGDMVRQIGVVLGRNATPDHQKAATKMKALSELSYSENLSPEETRAEAAKILEGLGYDGLTYTNVVEDPGSTSYVPLRATQIKSVFNRGTFDPDRQSIMEMRERGPIGIDNPGGEWLKAKQVRAEEDMATREGTSYRSKGLGGATTAYTREAIMLPVSMVAGLKGSQDEVRAPGNGKFDRLLEDIQAEGFKADQNGNAILVGVNHKGQAYLLEGNTRVAVAKKLGVETIRAEVRWFNGGEAVDGAFSPAKVASAMQPAQARPDAAEMRAGGLLPVRARAKWRGLLGSAHWKDPGAFVSNTMTDAMAGKGGINSLALVPGRALFSELGKRLLSAKTYLKAKEEMDSLRNDWHGIADETAQVWRRARNADPRANDNLMDLMHRSTLSGIDPSKPDTWKHAMAGPAEREVSRHGDAAPKWAHAVLDQIANHKRSYATLRDLYKALPAEMQDIYRRVRANYDRLGDEFEKAVLENIEGGLKVALKRAEKAHRKELARIKDDGLTGQERQDAIDEADAKLDAVKKRGGWGAKAKISALRKKFESNKLKGPYFPLARFGQFFVTIRDDSGTVTSFSRFETEARQQAFIREQKEAGQENIQFGVLSDSAQLKAQVDPAFVADIEGMLAEAGASNDVMDAIWQRWLETLPDQSIRTARIHRKGREGWNADAFRAYGHHMFHGAHQLARLKYGLELEEALNDAEDEARIAEDPNRAGLVVNEMRRRHQFTMNPQGSSIVAGMSSLAFVWYLGATPAAAIANLSQTTVLGPGIMAAQFKKAGFSGAITEIGRAMKEFGKGRGEVGKSDGLSTEEKMAMAEAYRRGTVDKTQAHDLASVAETGIEYNAARENVMRKISWFFHKAEVMNREVTFLASYRLARADGMAMADAIDTAADLTWKIHFDYQNTSRPRFMQNDMGKALTIFRQFTVNLAWRVFRDVHQSLKGATAEERAEARTQLIGTMLSMMAHAGIKGTYGYGLIMLLLSMFFPGDSDDIEEWMQDALLMEGDGIGTAAWNYAMGAALNGVPGQIIGADLSERIGSPNIWFRGPSSDLEGEDLVMHYVSELLGPPLGIALGIGRGVQQVTDGEIYRGVETAVPKVMRDIMKAGRYMAEGVETRGGDDILESVNPWQILLQASGFTPAQVAERFDMNSRLKNKEREILDERKGIHKSVVDAVLAGDPIPEPALESIRDFNRRFPEYPITADTIRQSAQGRQRARNNAEFGVTLNSKISARLRADLAEPVYN